jgi:hypothetical protein
MTITPPLALSNLIDITVSVSPTQPLPPSFNQGLFIANTQGTTNGRLTKYGPGATAALAGILAAGYTISSPEYIAAQIYFSQTQPATYFWVGAQITTAIQTAIPAGRTVTDGAMSATVDPTDLSSLTANFVSGDVGSQVVVAGAGSAGADLVTTIATVSSTTLAVLNSPALTTVAAADAQIGAYGVNYRVDDLLTVAKTGGSYGQMIVLTVGPDGQVLTLGTVDGGTGYSTGAATISGGHGTGLALTITAVGETPLQAAVACRSADSTWYGLAVYNPVDADNLALAEWADPLWQTTRYYPWSSDAAVAAGTTGNVALQLQALKLRVFGVYATTQGGLYPNNIYAAAALMGVDMGLNTGLAGSFFSAAYKELIGIAPEPLTESQYTAIINAGFNVYASFGPFQTAQPGFMSNGDPSYLWLFLAVLVAQLQYAEMDVLTSLPVVLQNNAGEHLLIQAANNACTVLANIGFLATSTWEGVTINIPGVALTPGQAIVGGFLNQAQPYSQQSTADRDAGKAMPIYCAVTTAGAVQSLVIGVYTQL